MNLVTFTLFFGLMVAVGAQSLETTSLTACVNDSISLPGNGPSRLVKQWWWKARYQESSWIDIGHCVKTKGCITSTKVLPDFTRVWIGSNESLIVERSADQRNSTAQFQFLVEDNLKRRHIFKVNFTVYCIWTELSGNLNLSQIALGLYPTKHLVELYLFDANGTQFAAIHSDKGASLQITNESHPMTAYWKRLRIERDSLIFLDINEADNGTKIIVQALLNSEKTNTRLEALSSKTIQIFVFYSAEPTGSPRASTSLSSKDIDDPPSLSSTPKLNGQKTKTSSGLAWYEQAWGIVLFSLVAVIIIIIVILIILLIKMKRRSSGSSSLVVPPQIAMSPSISTRHSYPQVNRTESVRRR
ncbi:uncharacterized protein [Acropora muricata]|uniref:uncharacterized protein LOC114962710 n=1 Tax=Acropora millepora TaxID=45264 RepID=UPI001CF1285A|nr:uncharacterized protein LOC114962710 [Acropora millepora]